MVVRKHGTCCRNYLTVYDAAKQDNRMKDIKAMLLYIYRFMKEHNVDANILYVL